MEVVAEQNDQGQRRRAAAARALHLHPPDARRIQGDPGSRAPARRAGDDQQPAQHVRRGAQGRAAACCTSRGRCGSSRSSSAGPWTPRATSRSIRCGWTRGSRRPARPDLAELFQPGKYEVYILGDVDSTAFTEAELEEPGRGGQPRGGPDHAGRVPQFRARRLLQHAPGRRAAGSHGPLGAAAAGRPDPRGRAPAGPAADAAHALRTCGTSPWPWPPIRRESAAVWTKLPPLDGANKFLKLPARRRRPGRCRRRREQAPAGDAELRQRPRDGLRRRLDLALVDARLRVGPQTLLAAGRALAGPQGSSRPRATCG